MKKSEIDFSYSPERACFVLKSELIRPYHISKVFPFFASAENLGVLTPDFLNFKILSPLPIKMEKGALIDYQIKLRYVPINWRTKIADWNPPYSFIDEQIRGPYLLWHHEHQFVEVSPNETNIIDIVHYKVPGGRLINALFVRPELKRIFNYRMQKMIEIFP